MFERLCLVALSAVVLSTLSACVVVPNHGHGPRYVHDRHDDGAHGRRDRDGDGVPNRRDRRPDNPYRR